MARKNARGPPISGAHRRRHRAEPPIETLTLPEQQLVEIAKAIGAAARVLIMDEPSASLTGREVDRLLEVVRRLRAAGSAIVHLARLEEACALADRVTVLRDGETVGYARP